MYTATKPTEKHNSYSDKDEEFVTFIEVQIITKMKNNQLKTNLKFACNDGTCYELYNSRNTKLYSSISNIIKR